MTAAQDTVLAALGEVHDPCSVASGRPISLVDMGIVWDCEVDGDVARVRLLPTTPGCLLLGAIAESVEARVLEVPGIGTVELSLMTGVWWSTERMTAAGRASMGGV